MFKIQIDTLPGIRFFPKQVFIRGITGKNTCFGKPALMRLPVKY
jgi:hypothetical protein